MTKILNLLWRGWMIILGTVLTLVLGIPVYLLSFKKEHYPYAYKFIRLWALGMFYGMGFRYELIKLSEDKIEKDKNEKLALELSDKTNLISLKDDELKLLADKLLVLTQVHQKMVEEFDIAKLKIKTLINKNFKSSFFIYNTWF